MAWRQWALFLLLASAMAMQVASRDPSEFMDDPAEEADKELFPDDEEEPMIDEDVAMEQPPPKAAQGAGANSVPEYYDEDEFEGVPPSVQNTAGNKPSGKAKNTASSAKDTSTKAAATDYTYEMMAIAFLVVYAINYFIGSNSNQTIADHWLRSCGSFFEKQFFKLGAYLSEPDSTLLIKESNSIYKFYASGRRHCTGLLATLELVSRHDLFSIIASQIDLAQKRDRLVLEMPLLEMDPFVFAITRRRDAKKYRKELEDLRAYAQPIECAALPPELTALTDCPALASVMVDDRVSRTLAKHVDLIKLIHITDQNPKSFAANKKCLRFEFFLPKITDMPRLNKLIAMSLYFVDIVATTSLSVQNRSKAEAKRAAKEAERLRATHEQRQEEAMRRKDERIRKEMDAEPLKDQEAQRRREAREYKNSLKRKQPKVKMMKA